MPTLPDWGTIQQVHAAWVQAIGSIGAILVAVIVPTALWALDRHRAHLAEKRRLQAIATITRLAQSALRFLRIEAARTGLPGSNVVAVEAFHEVRIAADAINSIRIDELGSPTLVTNVTTIKRCIGRASGIIPEMLPPTGTVLASPLNFAALVEEVDAAQWAIDKEVGSLR
ncbi:hypothetical protein [Paraburkholderia acidiphila]|uniref:Transmembrane protein n=1 Tax=Paraburkholderia acidiphila TaxID=2571747 RepID=A0A7Z2G3C5_9BURK|nr:hypothetical protein [Paraburkholderia acidiphila]QGZ54287.1 hypothetical protein FAZ97_04795 [Paraburkholderia acidiphila]